MDRRVVQVERGLLRIDQRLRIEGVEVGSDASGPACVYAMVRVGRGTIRYRCGNSFVCVPRRFSVFLPPFGVVQASLDRCTVTSIALSFRADASDDLPRQPVLLPADDLSVPESRAEALDRLRRCAAVIPVSRAPDPAPLAARAKVIIDGEYARPLEIAGIAARLHTSPAVLSRTFRHAYGMPPVRYRHHVRVMDALLQFAEGAVPAAVFQNVGFDDLSRFYKIFRKVSCAPPGAYRPARSKTAKT